MKAFFLRRKWILLTVALLFTAGLTAFLLVWNGVILLNNPSKERYPVRGVDVSTYQGLIDWETLAAQDISFAFIKATEGSSFTDLFFAYNYEQAQKTHLRIGAYHFFSFDSPGETQAKHYIETVPKIDGMLPPVIDVEFYGDKKSNPPTQETVREQLSVMIALLREQYGCAPILYAAEDTYERYLANHFPECDIWIRSVYTSPHLTDGREWTFWQYTNRKRLDGYEGEERFIDMNVFSGTEEEFAQYGKEPE